MSVVFKLQENDSSYTNDLFKSGFIRYDEKKNIRTTGSSLGFMYGIPKVHKSGLKVLLILPTVKLQNNLLSKYLVKIV